MAPQECDSEFPEFPELTKLSADSTAKPFKTNGLPGTLREAVGGKDLWSGIFGLCVYLRCGEAGMDSRFLKRAEVVRRRSRRLNWHQLLSCLVIMG